MKTVTVCKWGNSQGVRIPKIVLDSLEIKENESLEIEIRDGEIALKKIKKAPLKERLEAYFGKPIEEINKEIEAEQEIKGE